MVAHALLKLLVGEKSPLIRKINISILLLRRPHTGSSLFCCFSGNSYAGRGGRGAGSDRIRRIRGAREGSVGAGNAKLLDLVGISAGGCGVDGDLEVFTAGVKDANKIFLVGFRSPVGYLEGAGGVGAEEIAEDLAGLGLGAVAGRRQDGEVQIVCKPAGE